MWLAFGILVFVLAVLAVYQRGRDEHPRLPRLYKGKELLTANEVEFYGRLCRALPGYVVLAQVAMGAIIQPRVAREKDSKEFFRVRRAFAQKIIDYVVCDPVTMTVVAVIELDDRTHDKEKDAIRDAMVAQAGYQTLRFESKAKPTEKQIAACFPLPKAKRKPRG